MIKMMAFAIACFALSGCSDWVENYDLNSNRAIKAHYELDADEKVILTLKGLAKQHELRILVYDASHHAKHEISASMRNKHLRVYVGGSARAEILSVGFFKAVDGRFRPSDEELGAIVDDFVNALDSINGVEIIREQSGVH